MNTWRAGCGESRTSGSEGGPGKPAGRDTGKAPRSDPYTKLKGPVTWTYFYLYVILDVFSRYVVGWMVAEKESSVLAKEFIEQTCVRQGIDRDQLVLHADRGPSMTSKTVAQLLADLGVTKTHSHPYVSNDNPYSEAQFNRLSHEIAMKCRPDFPERFGSLADARVWGGVFFPWHNHEHYHSGIGLLTTEQVHYGQADEVQRQRQQVLDVAYAAHPERFVRGLPSVPELPGAVWINAPKQEPEKEDCRCQDPQNKPRRSTMNFYTGVHSYYCGVDLHARTMYLCILDERDQTVLHRNLRTEPEAFLQAIALYREGLGVAVECVFCWYWLADLCQDQNIDFILGHALYMKAVHGGKTKNDRQDAYTIAALVRGGTFPLAYAYPPAWRPTRDLLRRRNHLMRKRTELLAHIPSVILDFRTRSLSTTSHRSRGRPPTKPIGPTWRGTSLIRKCARVLRWTFNSSITTTNSCAIWNCIWFAQPRSTTRRSTDRSFYLLRSVPGVGKILAVVMMYEIHKISRFPRVQDFASYSRLVKPSRTSAGKRYGTSGKKIGSAHLKWAFSEAAQLFLRGNEPAKT